MPWSARRSSSAWWALARLCVKPKLDLQVKLTSYSEEMQRRGMVSAAKVLSFEQIGASAFLARELQLEEGTPLVRFRASCWPITNP